MKKPRVIARLDVKGLNVIKGIHLECLRVVGNPGKMAEQYYLQGADELIYLDIVANLYRRKNLLKIVNEASESIFIPFTAGGGVRTLNDIRALLEAGADKVAINTAATKNPELITKAAKMFGSQCIVVSIEAIKIGQDKWEAYTDNGREKTGLDAIEWAKRAEELGAGEILLTSIDMEGTENGFDLDLIKKVTGAVSIPVIASGGAGKIEDFEICFKEGNADAVATASLLHYKKYGVDEIKERILDKGIPLRRLQNAVKIPINPDKKYDITNYVKFTLDQLKNENAYDIENGKTWVADKLKGDYLDKGSQNNKNGEKQDKKKEESLDDYDIGVIDCGINNLKSILKAFEKIGKRAKKVSTPENIMKSKALVLPGVGAFKKGMDALNKKRLIEPIKQKVREGTPLLGICLGMQLLFSESEEFGVHKGLDLIPGRVISLKSPNELKIYNYRLPHIGWNELKKPSFKEDKEWDNTLLTDTSIGAHVYFVHSFYPVPEDKNNILAVAEYGNQEFCAVVKKDNISATQFHPERSGTLGLQMIKSFCEENNI